MIGYGGGVFFSSTPPFFRYAVIPIARHSFVAGDAGGTQVFIEEGFELVVGRHLVPLAAFPPANLVAMTQTRTNPQRSPFFQVPLYVTLTLLSSRCQCLIILILQMIPDRLRQKFEQRPKGARTGR
jgi:hypothetical protein